MEQETKIKTVKVRYMCDDCGNEVTFTGCSYGTNRMRHIHMCKRCCKEYRFDYIYPEIRYKEVGKINE